MKIQDGGLKDTGNRLPSLAQCISAYLSVDKHKFVMLLLSLVDLLCICTVADPDLQLRRGPAFHMLKGLTMNVEFCEDNSGTSKKTALFPKN